MKYDLDSVVFEIMFYGFFSEYLPDNFNLHVDNFNVFEDIEISKKNDFVKPYVFTMSRFAEADKRRTIYLPELASYIAAIKYMKDENIFKELIDFSLKSKHSFSKLITNGKLSRHEIDYGMGLFGLGDKDELIKSTYIPNVVKKINLARGAKGILFLDISNFYGSIYTHIIPAIILGYDEGLKQYKLFSANEKRAKKIYKRYKNLDGLFEALNSKRTNGLLTGPLISQIVAEALLTRIDEEIEKTNIKYSRYSDDYEIIVYDESKIDSIIRTISSILERYHLTLNNEKTKYEKFPYYAVENLEKIYSNYLEKKLECSDFMELFNKFFTLEKNGIKGATRFLVKSFDRRIDIAYPQLFGSYLLNILVNDDRSLTKICELLCQQKNVLDFQQGDIEILIDMLNQYIDSKKDLEVVWLLYLLKNLGINQIDKNIIYKVMESKNELALIIILYEYKNNIDEKLKESYINNANSWILLYQLFLEGYITKEDFKKTTGIKNNIAFYSQLKRRKFTFYKPIT